MKSIWTAPSAVLQTALSRYPSALPPKPALPDLEAFLTTLRAAIPTRKPPHITSAEYQELIRWKLARGKWRPRLQKFAEAVTDQVMIPASEEAFASYARGEKSDALRRLTVIKGCGPASASLVLALVGACFMGDEVLEAALGERRYTDKAFLQLDDAVEAKCEQLGGWSAWDVEHAIYAAVKLGITGGKKRARGEDAGGDDKSDKSDKRRRSKRLREKENG